MKTLIVTGGIGSGKSFLCRYLEEAGVPVYDADSRTKNLYDTCPCLLTEIEKALGCTLRGKDGRLDRKALASIVFSDRGKMSLLEAVVHPKVKEDFLRWKDSVPGTAPFVVLESAIAQMKPDFLSLADCVLLVDAPEELRIERVRSRDGLSVSQICDRIKAQHFRPEEADAVVVNDSDALTFLNRVGEALAALGMNVKFKTDKNNEN